MRVREPEMLADRRHNTGRTLGGIERRVTVALRRRASAYGRIPPRHPNFGRPVLGCIHADRGASNCINTDRRDLGIIFRYILSSARKEFLTN